MTRRSKGRRLVWIRRIVQAATLALFVALLLATRQTGEPADRGWITLFFAIDPLILLATFLSTHSLAGLSLLALATVGITLLLGRVFCGWICPFGTLHSAASWFRSRKSAGRRLLHAFSRWQRAKFYLLFALVAMALLGVHWIGLFDPASVLYRSLATSFLPSVQHAIEDGATSAYRSDPRLGPLPLVKITEPAYRFFRDRIFFSSGPVFVGGGLILFVFFAAIVLNLYRPRFWCRYVCPLGALLGLCAKRSSLRLVATENECGNCNLCAIACPAAAQPEKPGEWLPAECFGCWNCVASCERGGLDFRFERPWRAPAAGSLDLARRATLSALLAGVAGAMLLRATPQARARAYNPELIRPPGALPERGFLQRCIQCGICMKACPTNGLHPTALEAGLDGLWTPMLVARIGYCDYECNLCGQLCPTGAIENLPLAEKKNVKIGLAVIDAGRCLPYAYGRECIVCEEHCPIPTKAIYFVETAVAGRDGSVLALKLPRVDPDLCTGCGICETKCPFKDIPAIRIVSANETRHPGNQPILQIQAPGPYGSA